MRCLFEKESKGSVSSAAADFKPLSCPCPNGWTVVPEGNVKHGTFGSLPHDKKAEKRRQSSGCCAGTRLPHCPGTMRCSNASLM